MNTFVKAGFTLEGRVQAMITERGKVVKQFPVQKNLILNQGMNGIATTYLIAQAFAAAAAGTGTTPTRDDSGLTQASQSGTTVTLSGGAFTFTNTGTDAGKMIKWDSGEEAMIVTVTDATHAEVDRSATVAAAEFTVYRTNQIGLTTETKRSNTYLTGASNCGSSWTGNSIAMKRTYDFTTEAGSITYNEIGLANTTSAGNNLFSRILLASPVSLVASQALRLVYTLTMTWTPNTTQTEASDKITGWTGANGQYQIQNAYVSYVNSSGNIAGNGVLEPVVVSVSSSALGSVPHVSLWTNAITFAAMGNQINGANQPTHTNLATKAATDVLYVAGNFYRDRTVTFNAGEANSASIRSFGLNESNGDNLGFIFVMANNQTKDNVHTLTLTFRISWSRVLA